MGILGRLRKPHMPQLDWRSDEGRKTHPVLRGIVATLCVALLCVPAVFINSAIGYIPCIAALLAIAFSYAYLRILARHLECGGISSSRTCPRNTDARFLVRFKSRTPLPFTRIDATFKVSDAFGFDDVLKHFSLALNPFENRDFEFEIRFAHVGEIEIGLTKIRIHDPLGLFMWKAPAPKPTTVEITPRIFPVDERILSSLELDETSESQSPFGRDGMDYTEVREYRPGDPMKAIHWKLFPRTNTMFTKIYETSGNPGIDVLCDLYSQELPPQTLMSIYDAIMELGLSLHRFGLRHSLRVDLVFYDRVGEQFRFSSQHEIDHHELLRRMPTPSASRDANEMPHLIHELTANSMACSNMIVCVSVITDALITSLQDARSRNKRVIVFLVLPEQFDEQERRSAMAPLSLLADEGISCSVFSSAEELREITLG